MENAKDNLIFSEKLLLEKLLEKEELCVAYFCGFGHNVNGALTGVVPRVDMVQMKLQKLDNALKLGDVAQVIKELNDAKQELDKITIASSGVVEMINRLQSFTSDLISNSAITLNFKDKLEELIEFLNCNLYFKHNVNVSIVDNLSKKMKYKALNCFIEPLRYTFEALVKILPEVIDSHKITLTISNDNKNIFIDFDLEFGTLLDENNSLPVIEDNVFELAKFATEKYNGTLQFDDSKNIKKINISLPL